MMQLSLLDTIEWARKCIRLFGNSNYTLLVAQVKPYSTLVTTYPFVFEKAFKRLSQEERIALLHAFYYLGSLKGHAAYQNVSIDNFDELYSLLVQASSSEEALKSANYLAHGDLIMIVLKALLLSSSKFLPKTYDSFLSCFRKQVLYDQPLVVQKMGETCDDISLTPGLYKDKMGVVLNTIFQIYQPPVKWFLLEQLMFFVPKQLVLFLVKGQSFKVQLELCRLILLYFSS